MDKKTRDRAINRWLVRFLLGPASLLSLLAFAIGLLAPDFELAVRPIAQELGLNHVVAQRTLDARFASAAYLYWVTFWLTSPLNVLWLVWVAAAERVPEALRALERANLQSGVRDPARFTLMRGHFVWLLGVAMFAALLATQLFIAHEPSYCKGCETSSVPGFIIINWGMTHILLFANYISIFKLISWWSVRSGIGS